MSLPDQRWELGGRTGRTRRLQPSGRRTAASALSNGRHRVNQEDLESSPLLSTRSPPVGRIGIRAMRTSLHLSDRKITANPRGFHDGQRWHLPALRARGRKHSVDPAIRRAPREEGRIVLWFSEMSSVRYNDVLVSAQSPELFATSLTTLLVARTRARSNSRTPASSNRKQRPFRTRAIDAALAQALC
jgi:hypothetical protein